MSSLAPQQTSLQELCINTIRFLAVDAVQKANSGHPGLPMEAAAIGYTLFTKFLKHNPKNPNWVNRDRFILSAGHGCMLLYSLLYLTGYDLSLDDIKAFRQWGSKTPGHPEYHHTPGVETTTGPLGQGFANGVGMGIAEKFLAAKFNRPNFPILDYSIYVICSDGDLMEGISHEAASLAGHLKLDNLIYIYLDNHITIEGDTALAYSDDVQRRFEGYHWHVQQVSDGNSIEQVTKAIQNARAISDKPSLIIARTHTGYGSPHKQDTAAAHGSPLGAEEVKLTKENLKWPLEPSFYVPEDALEYYRKAASHGEESEENWKNLFEKYKKTFPEQAAEFTKFFNGELSEDWSKKLPVFTPQTGDLATRMASGKTLNAIAPSLPFLLGGSGDLAPSTETLLKDTESFLCDHFDGRNFHFGIREHGMAGILNGIALTSPGFIPYGATFLNFLDYMKPSLRLAALQKLRVIYVFTHDSIGLGEDGPTHQPIEQLASLRATPNVITLRPADANETAASWEFAIQHHDGPVCLILSRQKLPILDQNLFPSAKNIKKGAYILSDSSEISQPGENPKIILMGSGSEVQLILKASEILKKQKIPVRVISFPSFELFRRQPEEYRGKVLPPTLKKRIAVEAASPVGWHEFVGDEGKIIGIDHFGASAPFETLYENFGLTAEKIAEQALNLLNH
jgi:transketolase